MKIVAGVAFLLVPWVAFTAAGWHVHRRRGGRGLIVLWLGASMVYGYAQYRLHCAQGMTCCVGGTNPWFHTGNPRYFTHYVPSFTAIGLAAFGAASLVIHRLHRRDTRWKAWPRAVALGTLAAIAGWIAGYAVLLMAEFV